MTEILEGFDEEPPSTIPNRQVDMPSSNSCRPYPAMEDGGLSWPGGKLSRMAYGGDNSILGDSLLRCLYVACRKKNG